MTKFLNKNSPFVSIVIPTLNEEKNLERLLKSLRELKYPKKKYEVVIVDGGSRDRTIEIAKEGRARVFFNKKKLRGAGCQIGVNKAKGEFIAFTDADCVVPGEWLVKLVGYLPPSPRQTRLRGASKEKNVAGVGGPNITPKDDASFAKASGEVIGLLTKAGARYGFSGGGVRETFHNSGCNVLYRKKAIDDVGGFNPDLITCEDEELDFRIREKGYKLLFTPEVVVDHYRRPTYKKILIQAYRFAFGRAQAIKLHFGMARWFHFVPSLLLLGICLISLIGLIWRKYQIFYLWTLVLLAFILVALFLTLSKKGNFFIYFLVLILWFLGWGGGFVKGLFKSR